MLIKSFRYAIGCNSSIVLKSIFGPVDTSHFFISSIVSDEVDSTSKIYRISFIGDET